MSPRTVTAVPEALPANDAGVAFAPFTATMKSDDVAEPPAPLSTESDTVSVLEESCRATVSPTESVVDAVAPERAPVAETARVLDEDKGTTKGPAFENAPDASVIAVAVPLPYAPTATGSSAPNPAPLTENELPRWRKYWESVR